ncbi:hypothetical protein [Clostridium botulinum]
MKNNIKKPYPFLFSNYFSFIYQEELILDGLQIVLQERLFMMNVEEV